MTTPGEVWVKNWKLKSRKTTEGKKRGRNKAQKQIIHKAVEWKKILGDGKSPLSEIAKKEGLTSCRVIEITNLLKLPSE